MEKRGIKKIASMEGKFNMNKRGISPVIATVLLITIVIVIIIIIFIWAKGTIGEAVLKNGENAENVCARIALDASLDGTTLSITNQGNIPISSFNLKFIDGDSTTTQKLEQTDLGPGESEDYVLNRTASAIEIYPIILGTVGDSETRKEYICEKNKLEV